MPLAAEPLNSRYTHNLDAVAIVMNCIPRLNQLLYTISQQTSFDEVYFVQ